MFFVLLFQRKTFKIAFNHSKHIQNKLIKHFGKPLLYGILTIPVYVSIIKRLINCTLTNTQMSLTTTLSIREIK